ncbi:MAG: YraN family protein [Ruminococcus sp.]|nr:YraN family protein [Ruminococcus sp.]
MGIFTKKEVGNFGEETAAKFLKKNKYKIIDTNYKTKLGEIDIICENRDYIVFVEVKTRKYGTPIKGYTAVNYNKQQHIIRTASMYLGTHKSEKQPRFDIIEVEYYADGTAFVKEHYEDAFWQRGDYGVF